MGSLSKSFTSVLILMVALSSLSLLMVKPACAQSIPKPSVPEFSVTFVEHEVLANTNHSYIYVNVTINYEPLKYTDDKARDYTIYYQIRTKNHFATDWLPYDGYGYGQGSSSDNNVARVATLFDSSWTPSNGCFQVDYQVKAVLANEGTFPDTWDPLLMQVKRGGAYMTVAESSDWSSTQTITIPESALSTPIPSPTSSPTHTLTLNQTPTDTTQQNIVYYLPVVLIASSFAIFIGIVVAYSKHAKKVD